MPARRWQSAWRGVQRCPSPLTANPTVYSRNSSPSASLPKIRKTARPLPSCPRICAPTFDRSPPASISHRTTLTHSQHQLSCPSHGSLEPTTARPDDPARSTRSRRPRSPRGPRWSRGRRSSREPRRFRGLRPLPFLARGLFHHSADYLKILAITLTAEPQIRPVRKCRRPCRALDVHHRSGTLRRLPARPWTRARRDVPSRGREPDRLFTCLLAQPPDARGPERLPGRCRPARGSARRASIARRPPRSAIARDRSWGRSAAQRRALLATPTVTAPAMRPMATASRRT